VNGDSLLRLRLRPYWEAVDAGALLLKRWAAPAVVLGVIPQALLAWGVGAWLGASLPWVAMIVLWWLRPIGDRLLLAWAGLRFFQPEGGRRGLFKAVRQSFDASFWADITWRRFSPAAVFLAPISFLEGSKNPKRRVWLANDQAGGLFLLAFTCGLAEVAVAYSLWLSLSVVLSPGLWGAHAGFNGYPAGALWVVLYSFGQLLVQPLYVFSCFSLYIAVRTRKEGWDLALVFRTARKALKLGAVLLVLGASLFGAPAVHAEYQPPTSAESESETAKSWEKALSGREYGHWEDGWSMRGKQTGTASKSASSPDFNPIPGGAETLRAVAIGLGALMLLTLIVLGTRTVLGRTKKTVTKTAAPTPRSSPWKDEVLALWEKGLSREALARLYRAALLLAAQKGLSVPTAATEEQCLRVVAADPHFGAAVSGLVRLWSERAWGGREPSDERFRAAVATLEAG
jgi:hypothetical protein